MSTRKRFISFLLTLCVIISSVGITNITTYAEEKQEEKTEIIIKENLEVSDEENNTEEIKENLKEIPTSTIILNNNNEPSANISI